MIFFCSRQKEMIINAYKSKLEANPKLAIREDRVDDFDKEAIRRKVHQFWVNRELPNLNKILSVVNEDDTLPDFALTSLWCLLKSMGFQFSKRGRNSALIENDDIRAWRRRYIRDIRKYREEGRPIYYLDETWVNVGDVAIRVWCDTTVQSSQAAFSTVFLPEQLTPPERENGSYKSKKNTNDYHNEMNGDSFRDWLEGVLPRLKDNTVIIMDNAPYHSVKLEKCPTSNWRKADIIQRLQHYRVMEKLLTKL
ncbi:DDE 3 domain-containing protein [Aphis craccivora]|uniref:DDE 3 domain-containing protein n=1 Tax=Aphis craccivora TaxID=307492 RepID=A0A6G0VM90_APHCR|nr:DDE 3 domain-containing protein [Aphis craccivora]